MQAEPETQMARGPRHTMPPDPPADDAPEYERAAWWRQYCIGLTREALAKRTGFSVGTIKRLESGAPTSAAVWKRYRTACAGVGLGVGFKWGID